MTTTKKTAKKSYEIARLFVEGAESRGAKRAAWGWTTITLSERQAEWLKSVVEREKGDYRSQWGDSRMYVTTWRGRPEDSQPGSGDIEFHLNHMRGRWTLEYQPADPVLVAAAKAAYVAEQRAWKGEDWEDVS
ncbi:hypothetical protein KW797_04795 [Candidatus Parcubacteria bacterium]|nr:hypothetical protein [Candidatus Parcubacteria bacterium]